MNSSLRPVFAILALVLLVAGLAWLYSSWVRSPEQPSSSTAVRTDGGSEDRQGSEAPSSPELLRALEAMNAQQFAEARDLLAAITPLHPEFVPAQRNLAAVHAALGEDEAAYQALQRVVTLQPEDARAHAQLAWGHYRLGRYREAEFSTLRALELAPQESELRYNLALFRLADGRLGEAIDAYHRAIELDGDQQSVADALEQVLRLEVARPESVDVQYVLAFFAKTLGQRELEAEKLQRCLELAPDGPLAAQVRQRLEEALRSGSR